MKNGGCPRDSVVKAGNGDGNAPREKAIASGRHPLFTRFRPMKTGTVMAIHFHEEKLPSADSFASGVPIAVDTEAMGLVPGRDRLCLVQLSDGSGEEHLVRFGPESDYSAPNLKALLGDPERLKLYHFARFDVAI